MHITNPSHYISSSVLSYIDILCDTKDENVMIAVPHNCKPQIYLAVERKLKLRILAACKGKNGFLPCCLKPVLDGIESVTQLLVLVYADTNTAMVVGNAGETVRYSLANL